MNETSLTQKHCIPCEAGAPALKQSQIKTLLKHISPEWKVLDARRITRTFIFDSFLESMDFVNKVAKVAESEGHHPDIAIFYSKVDITLWTHAIGGLSENDFILASKIDEL